MSLRINLKQEEILELTNIYTKEVIKVKCIACEPLQCMDCIFANPSSNNNEVCAILNCNGNYREDNTFVRFIIVE